MLSQYFVTKTKAEGFKSYLNALFETFKDKKIILYGAGEALISLMEEYPFKNLNIVAVADKKFDEETVFRYFKAIPPEQIFYQDYDIILITNELSQPVYKYLTKTMKIQDKEIKCIFEENIPDERISFLYAESFNFAKHLQKLNKKLNNKKIVIYGAGDFFQTIKEYYDLSNLNIIGISDRKFLEHEEGEEFLGYKVYSPDEIKQLKPDYVLVATKFYINIIEDLYYNKFKGSEIKIKPLLGKGLKTLIKEVWNA